MKSQQNDDLFHGTADSIRPGGPKFLTKTWTLNNDRYMGSPAEGQRAAPVTQPCYSGSVAGSDREAYNFVSGSFAEPADEGRRKLTRGRIRPTEQDRDEGLFHQKRVSTLYAPAGMSEPNLPANPDPASQLICKTTVPSNNDGGVDGLDGARTQVLEKETSVENLLKSGITVKVTNYNDGEQSGVLSNRAAVRVVKKGRVHFKNVVNHEMKAEIRELKKKIAARKAEVEA